MNPELQKQLMQAQVLRGTPQVPPASRQPPASAAAPQPQSGGMELPGAMQHSLAGKVLSATKSGAELPGAMAHSFLGMLAGA